ncbi:DUF4371 domain-containing protein [Trichonephila inaurata madagascariensis]|uniref:DUF4371 domain-containing protein n=1 Tax=Trichonephila inaurata madagascariensis TaxID=2747483 RepID=A0A8X6IEM0_9ARAC|nr:DUF4371 domain-containing protein [Trichonephila inaurata madagascariensis]
MWDTGKIALTIPFDWTDTYEICIVKMLNCSSKDESCDITDNVQLSIFVHYISNNFDTVEELLDLRQLVLTTGEDIFKELKNVIEVNKVEWTKLNSVCTDGVPCNGWQNKGFVALLENYLGRKVFKYHCIIHQEALCAKDLNLPFVADSWCAVSTKYKLVL